MTDHRSTLDPKSISQIIAGLDVVREAWTGDVTEVRRLTGEVATLTRELGRVTDRCDNLAADLRDAKDENRQLLARNATLEAQTKKLLDTAIAGRAQFDSLALSVTASTGITTAEGLNPKAAQPPVAQEPPADVAESDDSADDGTGLSTDLPMFLEPRLSRLSQPSV